MRIHKFVIPLMFIMAIVLLINAHKTPMEKDYDQQWKKADSLSDLGQPRSALQVVDEIYALATAENNLPQVIKTHLYRLKLNAGFEEDYAEKAITDLQKRLSGAATPEKQIIGSILGELYMGYYQANRYKLLNRTTLQNEAGEDIKTWDASKLLSEAATCYLQSLQAPGELKQIPLELFSPILVEEKDSKIFRPTLYDFLAHRALGFFRNDETGIIKPSGQFVINDPAYLGTTDQYTRIELPKTTTNDHTLIALDILQQLLLFHQADDSPRALIDADLIRLDYIWQKTSLPQKDSLYHATLTELQQRHNASPYSTLVTFKIAEYYQTQGMKYSAGVQEKNRYDLLRAAETCQKAIAVFPESEGAKNCNILLSNLRAGNINLTVEGEILPGKPSLGLITWKNVNRLYVRIIKPDFDRFRQMSRDQETKAIVKSLIGETPVKEWQINIPDAGDLQNHSAEFAIPSLDKGFWVVLLSTSENFSGDDQKVAWAPVWCTGISYVFQRTDDGSYHFHLLQREKGTALSNVNITAYVNEYDYTQRRYETRQWKSFVSDGDGGFVIPTGSDNKSGSVSLEFISGDDRLVTESRFYTGRYSKPGDRPQLRTFFFTDRAIYRPGQTVYFKAVVLEKTGDEYSIKPDVSTSVELFDVNYQKASEVVLRTNEYGSANGSFIIPSSGLNGIMTIKNESGSAQFPVEDYKRPNFRVMFDPVKESYRLGEMVTVEGNAKGYAGNALDGANVQYRVVRNSIFPWRDYYFPYYPSSPEMEITSGETITDINGKFSVTFTAVADQAISSKFKPVFNFTVFATVTDINGESQAGEKTVPVGYQALFIDIDIPVYVDRKSTSPYRVTSTNLNGEKQDTDITIEVIPLNDPGRLMIARYWEHPDTFLIQQNDFLKQFPNRIYDNENDPEKWKRGSARLSQIIHTTVDTTFLLADIGQWPTGKYLARLVSKDVFGTEVITEKYFTVFDAGVTQPPLTAYNWFVPLKSSGEPGEAASFLLGTSAKDVKMLYEIQHKGKTIRKEWIKMDREQKLFTIPILETYRGNFTVQVSFVRDNRIYKNSMVVSVPYTNKKLDLAFETFRSDLEPGSDQTWTITIRDSKGDKAAAEMLASMYDASLDAFVKHSWHFDLLSYYSNFLPWSEGDNFGISRANLYDFKPPVYEPYLQHNYDQLNWFGFSPSSGYFIDMGEGIRYTAGRDKTAKTMAVNEAIEPGQPSSVTGIEAGTTPESRQTGFVKEEPENIKNQQFEGMQLRRDFNETAFFYPDLKTDHNGNVVLHFKLPESLTQWNFMGLAWSKELMTGTLYQTFIAAKKLMVIPNTPRFFREGDTIFYSAKIVNLSDRKLQGTAMLELIDPLTLKPVGDAFGLSVAEKTFEMENGQSTMVSWKLSIPENTGLVTCRVKAIAGNFTDGEEKTLPVLSNRMMVTESLPLPVNGKQTKKFTLKKLVDSGESTTLKNYRLTLEYASNPAWYAVQALTVISEPDYKNAVSVFGSFYANSIAFHIANADPRIKRVFESWKNQSPESLLSKLEKNQELKNILIEQTPWLLQAKNESERKQRIALLFDINNMQNRLDESIRTLEKLQTPNGGFTWFDGMPESRYITQYVVEGLGKLEHLGILKTISDDRVSQMLTKAVRYLDDRIREDYEYLKKNHAANLDDNHLSSIHIQYLYARSFLNRIMLNPSCETAVNYYKMQAGKYWKSQNPYLQGMTALALYRYKTEKIPMLIVKSLKERSLTNDEMGMYWRQEGGYFWYEAPIETQAMMIEVFEEVAGDADAVEKMKVWLLKQKQTQDWESPRATVEAVYALIGRNTDLLASDELVTVQIGNEIVDKEKIGSTEAGTGYFETSWEAGEITPEMGKVTVTKPGEGIAWGALYWQYFEALDKITPHETPLSLKKQLFIERNTPAGPVLELLSNQKLNTGDKIKVRIELRVDRDMEFVHMKDMRASGFEPVNVLSGYRYQGGLGYYESTRDAATSFFFDHLSKGTWVFEYPLIASQKGEFSNGITTIQCLYAPEFTSHSEGVRIRVE